MQFLEQHHLLCDAQHGFRSGMSCLTNMHFTLERQTKPPDEGCVVHAIYIDFKKAFDSVPQQRLLHKLHNAGIGGRLLVCIQSCLAGLSESVQVVHRHSSELLPAETRCSTFGRELLAIYLAVKHFRHFLEGRDFTVFTDPKPSTFALRSHNDNLNPREIHRLDYIFQLNSDIRHIDRSRNEVADALSRPSIAHLQLSPRIDLVVMAAEQRCVGPPCDDDVAGLQLQELPLTTGNGTILCNVTIPSHRPFSPPSLHRKVFSFLHNLSRPGIRATDKLVSDRFVWPGIHKDLKPWTRAVNGIRSDGTMVVPISSPV
nr:unnamed protein product [Spirometra erinaceieuropaei]